MKGKTLEQSIDEFVSVIIPVYDDFDRLPKCLEALEYQTYPKNLYEVIVVDNNSSQDVSSISQKFAQVSFIDESRQGSYAARNKGISVSKGNILAFTDSDCIPLKNWIQNGVNNLRKYPNCGLLGGKIQVFPRNPERPSAVEIYDMVNSFPQKHYVEQDKFAVTANLFTYKKVIDDVGFFKDSLQSGGDFEWGRRVFSAGYQQVYADDTCVKHPARYTFSQINKKLVRVLEGHSNLRTKNSHNNLARSLVEFIVDLKPPRKDIINAYKNSKLTTIYRKIQVSLVILYVRYLRAWIKFKLQLNNLN